MKQYQIKMTGTCTLSEIDQAIRTIIDSLIEHNAEIGAWNNNHVSIEINTVN